MKKETSRYGRRLEERDIAEIKLRLQRGESVKDCAAHYDISQKTVYNIRNGNKAYEHVPVAKRLRPQRRAK